jgi:programmed cell death protein 5
MDDPDLEAIRQKRMAELQGQQGGNGSASSQAEQQEKQQQAEERRQSLLVAVMHPDARERLQRIALVKPDKARGVEDMILQMAQRGQLGGSKVSEEQLITLLGHINERTSAQPRVTIQRRNMLDDDDF